VRVLDRIMGVTRLLISSARNSYMLMLASFLMIIVAEARMSAT
jgi:hypothetical protein